MSFLEGLCRIVVRSFSRCCCVPWRLNRHRSPPIAAVAAGPVGSRVPGRRAAFSAVIGSVFRKTSRAQPQGAAGRIRNAEAPNATIVVVVAEPWP